MKRELIEVGEPVWTWMGEAGVVEVAAAGRRAERDVPSRGVRRGQALKEYEVRHEDGSLGYYSEGQVVRRRDVPPPPAFDGAKDRRERARERTAWWAACAPARARR